METSSLTLLDPNFQEQLYLLPSSTAIDQSVPQDAPIPQMETSSSLSLLNLDFQEQLYLLPSSIAIESDPPNDPIPQMETSSLSLLDPNFQEQLYLSHSSDESAPENDPISQMETSSHSILNPNIQEELYLLPPPQPMINQPQGPQEDIQNQSQPKLAPTSSGSSPQPVEYSIKKTNPVLGGGPVIGGRVVNSRKASTYDLVERMQFLFVRVVKAQNLPIMDITGNLDPFVEVGVGNYKGITRFSETSNPKWNEVFAFSKESMQASILDVVVKDKDMIDDECFGIVHLDINNIPIRVPPGNPLAPEWYRMEDKKGNKVRGELMLAVWIGIQADEAFPDAAMSNADSSVSSMFLRSQVYHSPTLWYVRVNVIEVQDLVWAEETRIPDVCVKVQINNQFSRTKSVKAKTANALWNEDLMFVAAEPFEDHLILIVEDRVGPGQNEILGRIFIPLNSVERRVDDRTVRSRWFNLQKPHGYESDEEETKKDKFATRVHLRVSLDGRYHVHDESTQYSSDLKPTAKELWKPSIGILEVGNLNASVLQPVKTRDGKGTTPMVNQTQGQQYVYDDMRNQNQFQSQSQPKVARMYSGSSSQPFENSIKETIPYLGGGQVIGGRVVNSHNKRASTYDLVEPMQFLFVRVVKAQDLKTMDLTGSLDPYVEVRIGNYKGITQHFSKTSNPEWNTVFAFSKEKMQASVLDVVVKDKDMIKDDFVGIIRVNLHDIPTRVPPDNPLAPEWYRMEDKKGNKVRGELMLAVWIGIQADEAFPDAAMSNADSSVSSMFLRSQVYHSPTLWYVRVNVIEVQDLVWAEETRIPDVCVKVQINNQFSRTKSVKAKTANALWNEDLMFVAAEPFEDHLILIVEDRVGPGQNEVLGRIFIPLSSVERHVDDRTVRSRWFNLQKPHGNESDEEETKKDKFATRVHLRVSLDGGYHVHDESTQYSSDLKPTAKELWKPSIGILEVGILNASVLQPVKTREGKGTSPMVNQTQGQQYAYDDMRNQNQNQNQFQSQSQPKVARMYSGSSSQPFENSIKETSPYLGGGQVIGGRVVNSHNKRASTYDLVEPMQFLFVRVVKAQDLKTMDLTGSLDPYVEVRIGNYKGITQHFSKTSNPEWNTVFAFSKEKMQASVLDVVVKDKDMIKDDFVGIVRVNLHDILTRVPPDSPLAPEWYRIEDKKGEKKKGELMLAVWIGTQVDEAFPDAFLLDAAMSNADSSVSSMFLRSKVYHSPRLWYVRVNIIEVQDLVWAEKTWFPDVYVKAQINNQVTRTRPVQARNANVLWNEDMMFVAADPFEDHLILSIEDRMGPGKDECLGKVFIPLNQVDRRVDDRMIHSTWVNLQDPDDNHIDEKKKRKDKFATKLHLRVCLDGGYHVLDESTQYSSDLRPTAKQIWKPSIGILELGILNASALQPMKTRHGKGTVDSYCVAKYGQKWVRTRTVVDNLAPRFNEQYTWEVYDPSTVLTVGVFDNVQVQLENGNSKNDNRIGKIRIRISTLETGRVYTHSHPLLVLHPTGVKKMGELHLAIRFSSTSMMNMMMLYSKPLLPKMHYVRPLTVVQLEMLRHQAVGIVAARLSRAEPPLRQEIVEYMTDVNSRLWSMRRSKANFFRLMAVFNGVFAVNKWFGEVCLWKNRITTVLVHILFVMLVSFPELILPTVFLYMFLIGLWNYRFRAQYPPHMNIKISYADGVNPDELDEEFDSFPSSRNPEMVRRRYDRLRIVAGRIQSVVGDIASQGERLQGLLSWRDPRATVIFMVFCLVAAFVLYATPFQVLVIGTGFYVMRHPRFRHRLPSAPLNFFRRLPARTDSML